MASVTRSRWLAVNYAITIFISAFLLFQVQPIVSKYILPWFGGSPAVWTTCMLFFQTLLFAGYAYAHFSSQQLSAKSQALLHLAIILMALAAVAWLRVVPDESWKPADSNDPIGRILLLLAASVGLPYFVLSTTGPLVQSWFARSFPGRTPYRLYALSNVGSLLALLSYPFLFERMFDVPDQASIWSWGFAVFAMSCAVAAAYLWMNRVQAPAFEVQANEPPVANSSNPAERADIPVLPWWRCALWLILPALASVTLLATTNHVCTDVAVMPFLWVIPLSLYLLTFIIAFDHPRWYRPAIIAGFTLVAIYWVGVGKGETELFECGIAGGWIHSIADQVAALRGLPKESYPESPTIAIGLMPYLGINFLAMFGICMLCHGELVRQRPHPKYLTAYYLLISAGGAAGAVAVTLLAPRLFNTFYEWELSTFFGHLLCVGILLWSLARWMLREPTPSEREPAENAASMQAARLMPATAETGREQRSKRVPATALLGLLVFFAVVGWIDLSKNLAYDENGVLYRGRNFFGTLVVREYNAGTVDRRIILKHGATTHGLQYPTGMRRAETTTYYTPFGGIGRTFNFFHGLPQAPALGNDDAKHQEANAASIAAVRAAEDSAFADSKEQGGQRAAKLPLRIAAVGLGAGTLAAYAGPGDSITFYEINPQVIDIADRGKWFTYLPDCRARGAQCEVKLGDARLTLDRELHEPNRQNFDLLVLDAFSGDAIPAHLLTDEAFKVYLPQLATAETDGRDGAIAIHITNHYVNLEPVVRGVAEKFGLKIVRIENPYIDGKGLFHADWMILTRNENLLAALAPFARSPQVSDPPPAILWTDAFSNLFDVLK